MAYRRPGRPSWYFEALTETGRKQLSTGTRNSGLARAIEEMWKRLATDHRAWDVLNPVLRGEMPIGRVYDAWRKSARDIAQLRRELADVNLCDLVPEWFTVQAAKVKPDSAAHALAHVRSVFPEGAVVSATDVDPLWLTRQLYARKAKRNTLRKIHSSLTIFLEWATRVRRVFAENPMARVDRPPVERTPIRFYEADEVEKIIAWQPNAEREALFALMYGTGIEVSVALGLCRNDIDESTKEVRAAGTKAHTRDRICRVADWAWPIFWDHARTVLPGARLFPAQWNRHTVSDWHRQTVGDGVKNTHGDVEAAGLQFAKRYPLHCARDHWAVRAARAGTPVQLIQAQLGHGSPMLALTKYGRFQPRAEDRARWEAAATAYDRDRRAAK